MKEITWSELKDFVKNLDINKLELNPEELSLNEIASVGGLLETHAGALYARVRTIEAKSKLDESVKTFKQFKDGAFDKVKTK